MMTAPYADYLGSVGRRFPGPPRRPRAWRPSLSWRPSRARAQVDDQRALALELRPQGLDPRRQAQAVAEVLMGLVDQVKKKKACRRRGHPGPVVQISIRPPGDIDVAAVEEVVVEDLRPRPQALVGLVAGALGLRAVAGVVGDVMPHADAAVVGGRPVGSEKYQRPERSPSSTRRLPSRAEAEVRRERQPAPRSSCRSARPRGRRMRCSAGMSSASATSGVSVVSNDTMSSTSWPSGS